MNAYKIQLTDSIGFNWKPGICRKFFGDGVKIRPLIPRSPDCFLGMTLLLACKVHGYHQPKFTLLCAFELFFCLQAQTKGVSQTVTGLIFSSYALTVLLFSNVWGYLVSSDSLCCFHIVFSTWTRAHLVQLRYLEGLQEFNFYFLRCLCPLLSRKLTQVEISSLFWIAQECLPQECKYTCALALLALRLDGSI